MRNRLDVTAVRALQVTFRAILTFSASPYILFSSQRLDAVEENGGEQDFEGDGQPRPCQMDAQAGEQRADSGERA